MPGFQERQLSDPGVGGEGLVAPAVGLLEQRQLGAGVRPFPADDDPHPGRPAAQVEQAGDLGDVGAVADLAVGVDRRRPRPLRHVVMALVNAVFLVGKPTEYSNRRPRTWAWPVSQSSSSWVAPAPSARTSSLRRCAAGTWAMARVRTSMWSPAWLLPALPGRSVTASSSVVLSHHTPSGWNPKPPLNVAAACSFSECAVTKRGVDVQHHHLAEVGAGDLWTPARCGSRPHTCRRTLARAFSTRFSAAGVASSSARHTVGADATGPSSPPWWRKHVDVGDRLTAGGQHHRHVDQTRPRS